MYVDNSRASKEKKKSRYTEIKNILTFIIF